MASKASFATRLSYVWHEWKTEMFFGSIALFALGTVVRQELIKNGVLAHPGAKQQEDIQPKIERKRRQRDRDQ